MANIPGTAGADNLVGTSSADTIDGGAGNDTLNGGYGDDIYLLGKGDGHDIIQHFYESATNKLNALQFKAGVLPTEVVVVRNGNHLIVSIIGTADKVTIEEFFSSNNPSNAYNPVQEFRFSNGTIWNLDTIRARAFVGTTGADDLNGTLLADTLDGGAGNDTLNGSYGDDIYLFGKGDGHDIIEHFYESATNKLNALQFKAGVLPTEVVVVRNGNHLIVSIIGTADKVTIEEFFSSNDPSNAYNPVQEFRFSNGTIWNLDTIRARAFVGTTGADDLNGTLLADTLDGGAGNDTLNGSYGDDIYLFGKGDGHDIIEYFYESATNKLNALQFKAGVLPTEVVVVRNGNHLIVSIIGTADKVTVEEFFSSDDPSNAYNPVQEFRFSNGTVWNLSAIQSRVNVGADSHDVLIGGSGADVIYGGGGNDYLYMGDDIDTAYGNAGIDVLLLDAGNDVGYGGADQDYLFGGAGNDTLHGEGGVDVLNGETGDDTIYGGDGGDYVYGGIGDDVAYGEAGNDIFVMDAGNDSADGGVGQDYFYMGDGDDFAQGGDGVDVFLGGAGNDTFEGGATVDYAWGGTGNDSFVVRASSGVMVVQDFTAGGMEDQVRFAADTGLRSLSKVLAASTYYSGMNTTIVTIDADTAIWLVGVSTTQLTAGDFVFV